ncbi:hypothetical protein ANCCAN_01399 [Ancylostoma caninum]|uniref:SCP domain-containing protein n=1 Tax=Ancylostoma caninum TaxID=29170 RepID=A0A368HAL6_ANCCA|nr:hypothetical protein ANCCAN_01399 [Ancylostoma caninum]
MKAFLVLLATVAIHLDFLHAEDVKHFLGDRKIIMDRPRACNSVVNLRLIYDDFHNTLRQKVAGGIPVNFQHFQKRLMYGLIYDCQLEKEAEKEVRKPGTVKNYPALRFSKLYGGDKGTLSKVVEEGLKELAQNDKKALFQMIYPKATRFACGRTVKRERGTKYGRVDVACIYDKKAELTAFRGEACNKDADCTYYASSKCQYHLCYVPLLKP